MGDKDLRISSKEAADLLGVSVCVIHSYNIPYQQFKKRGRRTYLQNDVVDFKRKHTFNTNIEVKS
ncbi:MAG: hypothetical protein JG718_17735 [Candidatus Thiothrix moscowensis]|nr:hypothetical protein [Candidatus Thiothrix moscowensis]